jgi:hypothetical protein
MIIICHGAILQAVLERMKDVSNSTVVYKGMEAFKNGAERIDVTQLPGLMNSGWDPKRYARRILLYIVSIVSEQIRIQKNIFYVTYLHIMLHI